MTQACPAALKMRPIPYICIGGRCMRLGDSKEAGGSSGYDGCLQSQSQFKEDSPYVLC